MILTDNMLTATELKLMYRALMLLSCVVEGAESHKCLKLAGIFKAEMISRAYSPPPEPKDSLCPEA